MLERESLQGTRLGFTGKQVIHPAQVEAVQRIFTPSEKEVEWARQVLALAQEFADRGQGAFAFGGAMVDRPVIKRAESILARAGR